MSELNTIRYDLPEIKRALILAPHPDDETLGCGGTIALYSETIDFTVVVLSSGEAVNIEEDRKAELRKREFADAMEILGVSDTVFLEIPDERFHEHREVIREELADIYRKKYPEMVFSPSPFDIHPDHEVTARACVELNETFPSVRIAFYEVYNPQKSNTLIDIGSVVEKKKAALKKYHFSMLKKEDIFITSILSLNKSRSVFPLRDSYYESFWIPDNPLNIFPALPEDRLLSTIKTVDSLIHRVREFESAMAVKDKELTEQGDEIQKLGTALSDRENEVRSLNQRLTVIEGSLFWRLVRKWYTLRDSLLPDGTGRRNLYDRIISGIKSPFK